MRRRIGKTASWCLVALAAGVLLLLWLGYPEAVASRYPVKGIDVSAHQGNINWKKAAGSAQVRFAYIKATEGADFMDSCFSTNWKAAGQAGVVRGAYHYFKVTSLGHDQAANFIAIVHLEKGCLPPAVDIEEGGVSANQFRRELGDFISAVEARYGCKPVLYVTYPMYAEYVKGCFEGCPIWIRDVSKPPALPRGGWLFWQYGARGRVPGINGDVDTDVFAGSEKDFKALLSK
jgi:lysozyme